MILALVRDLLFASKITSTAQARGVAVKIIRDPSMLHNETGTRLLVDLNQPGALEAAAQWRLTHSRPVLGFVSHVDADTIARAREAGIEQILARGQFVQQLAQLLQ
jgi:hypothetical protein